MSLRTSTTLSVVVTHSVGLGVWRINCSFGDSDLFPVSMWEARRIKCLLYADFFSVAWLDTRSVFTLGDINFGVVMSSVTRKLDVDLSVVMSVAVRDLNVDVGACVSMIWSVGHSMSTNDSIY